MSKKIGLFGGSFDPIHLGHIITAQYVFEKRNLDEIIFMPCFISPHKTESSYTSPIHRLNMVRLAIANNQNFSVSDMELKREKVSYTIDTINELRKVYDYIELIIGQDNLDVFDKWHKPDEIISKAKLIVLKRKTNFEKSRNQYYQYAEFVETPVIEISSTEIRERVKMNLPIEMLVGKEITNYIYSNKLYL